MKAGGIALASAVAGAATLAATAMAPSQTIGDSFADDFDAGLCVGRCPGARWAIAQQVGGSVTAAAAPDRAGRALLARTGPKRAGVTKADIVARLVPLPDGSRITVAFDLRVPRGTPLNSLQLVDLECARCGEAGNPGIRLYLRRGRFRIDRSKIGIADAWTRDDAPVLAHDRWHRVAWSVRVGGDDTGRTRVLLDGREVLAARGATIAALARRQVDRVQIGITANSNPVASSAWFDDVRVTITR